VTRKPNLENKRFGVQFLEADLITIGLPFFVTQRPEPYAYGDVGHPGSRTFSQK
jgi:hypothetical protein